MSDPFLSLFDDPEESDPEEEPAELESLIERFSFTPVKKESNDSMQRKEEDNGSLPFVGENKSTAPVMEENNGNISDVWQSNTNELRPVMPGESGEGLPYAPINWPNPGDNWIWRVGHRCNAHGFFMDRFIYLPKSLQKTPRSRRFFNSKPALEKYIRFEFPDADVHAFFASFSWKVPAKTHSSTKEKGASLPHEDVPLNEGEKSNQGVKEEPRSQRKRKTRKEKWSGTDNSSSPLPQREKKPRAAAPLSFKPREENLFEGMSSPITRETKKRHAPKLSNQFSPKVKNHGHAIAEEPEFEDPIPPDFDNYLDSIEDMLQQPLTITPPSFSTQTDAFTLENEMYHARNKLSSLLLMDFPTLVETNYFSEVVALASKVRKDPRLTAEQLVKLKLIEEIPVFSEVYIESREIINQVHGLFATLEGNKAKASSLKSEYNELKEKADELQAQVDSNSIAVQEIDNQISQLQQWRAELMTKIESNKAAKFEVTRTQNLVAKGIPPLVQEVQVAHSKINEWMLRRTIAEKRLEEILEKFAPLQGFSL